MPVQPGSLYVVATPIGNPQDITLRAIEILSHVDAVVCEEIREGSTLLKRLGLQKPLISLNEHNEQKMIPAVIDLLHQNQAVALISDCGTPVFADPGHALIHQLLEEKIPIIPVPGPSSLMTALSILDFRIENFVFAGFLPRDRNDRRKAIKHLRFARIPMVFMDTPYRLDLLLEDLAVVVGGESRVTLACDLTLPGEQIMRGSIDEVRKQAGQRKSEFVLILH